MKAPPILFTFLAFAAVGMGACRVVFPDSDSQVTFQNALGIDNTLCLNAGEYTGFGTGVDVPNALEVRISGEGAGLTVLSGRGADKIFAVTTQGTRSLILSQLTLSGGYSSTGHGSCLRSARPVELYDVVLTGCITTNFYTGGAAYITGVSLLRLMGVVVEDNFGTYAGGIAAQSVAVIEVVNSTFRNNTAFGGGGALTIVRNYYAPNNTAMTQVAVSGASAFVANVGNLGGAIGVSGGALNLTVSGETVFVNNTATARGGGICVSLSSPNAVSFIDLGTGLSMTHNTGGQGGALYVAVEPALGSPVIVTAVDLQLTDNVAYSFNGGGASLNMPGNCTLVRPSFFRNEAAQNGGGLYFRGSALSTSTSTLVVESGTFVENTAENGGGLCVVTRNNATVFAVLENLAIFVRNSAKSSGGAVAVAGEWVDVGLARLSGPDGRGARLSAISNTAGVMGGALVFHSAEGLLSSACVVRSNTAGIRGGGLAVDETAVVAFVPEAAPATLPTFSLNVAINESGGALSVSDESTLTASHVTLEANSAPKGGAVAGTDSAFIILGPATLLFNNNAQEAGGMYLHGSVTVGLGGTALDPVVFLQNIGSSGGAGLSARLLGPFNVSVVHTRFDDNNAAMSVGATGAMHFVGEPEGAIRLEDVEFNDNVAQEGAAAVFLHNVTVVMVRVFMTANEGQSIVALEEGASLVLTSSSIAKNQVNTMIVPTRSTIFLGSGPCELTVTDTTIHCNTETLPSISCPVGNNGSASITFGAQTVLLDGSCDVECDGFVTVDSSLNVSNTPACSHDIEPIGSSHVCSCDLGFVGDGLACADINECAQESDSCSDPQSCENTPGSYDCACKSGFAAPSCSNVNECLLDTDTCAGDANCTDSDGSFTCTCRPGYGGNGTFCEDLDECADSSDDCAETALCINSLGSFTCLCEPGYEGNGRDCSNINECTASLTQPLCEPGVTSCEDTVGSFVCVCDFGAHPDGSCILSICGDNLVNGTEECDDGNTVGGDGCTVSCFLEEGSCEEGVWDCRGVCEGFAFVDGCGVCSAGTTGVVPNSAMDDCGVCFGGNVDADTCGVCGGNNDDVDACGVCYGDGTTCEGCDGLPNSGLVVDLCGVCGGDGTSCLGCNGLPMYSGGTVFDVCGLCGGSGNACEFDCTGTAGGGSLFDCAGVCGGNATLDACGVCSGGTTNVSAGFHDVGCGCFSDCFDECTEDACGVCGGSSTTCADCEGVPQGAAHYDACGVCGGSAATAAECSFDCAGVAGGPAAFDCGGMCGGLAALDLCGVCTGGLTGLAKDMHRDRCGVCFGGDTSLDGCGMCGGNEAARDLCGVCNGTNADRDPCGVCYGYGRSLDACGVCGGNSTSCLGCDGVPNSGFVLDENGDCVDPSPVPPPNGGTDEVSEETKAALAVIGASVGGGLLVLLVCVPVGAYYIRKKMHSKVAVYLRQKMDEAPTGDVTFVFTDVQGSTDLWEAEPAAMAEGLALHNDLFRRLIDECCGYEVKTEGDAFMITFHRAQDAVAFCVRAQGELMNQPWPRELLLHPCAAVVMDKGSEGVKAFSGLRVRMGIHSGVPQCDFDKRAERMDYYGPCVNLAARVGSAAAGGEVRVSESAMSGVHAYLETLDDNSALVITSMGETRLKGIKEPVAMWRVLPKALAGRVFETSGGQNDTHRSDLGSSLSRSRHGGSAIFELSGSLGEGGGVKSNPVFETFRTDSQILEGIEMDMFTTSSKGGGDGSGAEGSNTPTASAAAGLRSPTTGAGVSDSARGQTLAVPSPSPAPATISAPSVSSS